jgi:hypothetical protein
MKLQPPVYDVVEVMGISSEMEQYYRDYGDPVSGAASNKK